MKSKFVKCINQKYQFQSPPSSCRIEIKECVRKQINTNNSFNIISDKTFYYPCTKNRVYNRQVEESTANDLEEITDRPIYTHFLPTDVEESQLSPYFPKFVNRVETNDVQTQTETCDIGTKNYIYDFYIEVVPILERLVGYTIEQAMTEIGSEEKVRLRKNANHRFNVITAAERVEVNRRREETWRREDEIHRRLIEESAKCEENLMEKEVMQYKDIINSYMIQWFDSINSKLKLKDEEHVIMDQLSCDIKQYFIPNLFKNATSHKLLINEFIARFCLDGIIRDAVNEH